MSDALEGWLWLLVWVASAVAAVVVLGALCAVLA